MQLLRLFSGILKFYFVIIDKHDNEYIRINIKNTKNIIVNTLKLIYKGSDTMNKKFFILI